MSVDDSTPLLSNHLLKEPPKPVRRWSKVFKGVGAAVCIVGIISSWLTMAQLLQNVGNGYKKPFFQAYFIHSFYSVMYIGWKLWILFPGNLACNRVGEGTLTNFKSLAVSTGVLSLMVYLCGAFWYISLTKTSLSANTAVYQSASALVFVISVPVLRERVSLLKVLSVFLTVTGVCLISVFSAKKQNTDAPESNTPLGYVYLVISTILYATSEVGFKKFATKPDDPAPIQNGVRGLGYFGVHTLLWMWPLLVLLHFTGLEKFELPDLPTLNNILLNAFLDLVFNSCLYVCIALTSPLIASVGSMLVVPASLVVDWLIHHYLLPWQAIVGAICILAGFFFLTFSESMELFCWHKHSEHSEHLDEHLEEHLEESLVQSINARVNSRVKKRRKYLRYIF